MIKGEEVKVEIDLDYAETIKDIQGEEATGADFVKKYANGFITASVINNKNRENLDIFKEIYTQETGENPRDGTRVDNSEDKLKRNSKRRFRDLADQLVGTKNPRDCSDRRS